MKVLGHVHNDFLQVFLTIHLIVACIKKFNDRIHFCLFEWLFLWFDDVCTFNTVINCYLSHLYIFYLNSPKSIILEMSLTIGVVGKTHYIHVVIPPPGEKTRYIAGLPRGSLTWGEISLWITPNHSLIFF